MYVVKVLRGGEWVSWGSASHPRVINMYLDLLKTTAPKVPVKVDTVADA